MYLNGVLENQVAWAEGIFPGTAPLVIGANYFDSVFNGLIDEISLYNRALSGTEIQQIYDAGSAGKCGLPPVIPELLTYYLRFLRITGPFAKSEARGVGTQTCPLFCE